MKPYEALGYPQINRKGDGGRRRCGDEGKR